MSAGPIQAFRAGWWSALPSRSGVRLAAAAVLLTVAAATGCTAETDQPATNGPVTTGGDRGTLCVPTDDQTEATIAHDNLRTTEQVVIDGIRLVEPKGMQLRSTELMPILHRVSLGVWPGYPPRDGLSKKIAWDQRQQAAGATLRPRDPRMEMVLRVRLTEPVATAEAIEVAYTADGKSYVARTSTRFELRRGPSCASSG